MRTLVTGGAGFIGSHLVDLLLANGNEPAVVDNLATGKRANLDSRVPFYEVDVTGPDLHHVLIEHRPDVVFHQAAQASVKASTDDPLYDARVNVLGLLNVLEGCVGAGVRKVVFASSGATYGNPSRLPMDELHPQQPEAPYGITKLVGEHYLRYYARDRALAFTALRYGNVYGPRQDACGEAGVVATFTRQLLTGQRPTIHWDGEQIRDYVYVGDVAQANLQAATAGDGQAFCIGTGVGTSVNLLYRSLCEIAGIDVEPHRGPRRAGDLRAAYFDTSLAQGELGWKAEVSLRDGLSLTVEAFRTELEPELATSFAYGERHGA